MAGFPKVFLAFAIFLKITSHSTGLAADNVTSSEKSLGFPQSPKANESSLSTENDAYSLTTDGSAEMENRPKLRKIVHTSGRQIGLLFHICYLPFLCTFGFIGNTLSLLVLRQPKKRNNPVCVYGSALAVSDTLMLLVAFHHWLRATVSLLMSSASVDLHPPIL